MIDRADLKVSTTGGAGAATGSGQSRVPVQGLVEAIHLSYATNIPSNTAVVIRHAGDPNEVILSVATSGWYYPRRQIHTSAGSGVLYAAAGQPVTDHYVVYDHLLASVSSSDAVAEAVVARVYLRK